MNDKIEGLSFEWDSASEKINPENDTKLFSIDKSEKMNSQRSNSQDILRPAPLTKSDSFNLEMYTYNTKNKYPITPLHLNKAPENELPGSPTALKPGKGEKKLLVYHTPSMKYIANQLLDIGKSSIILGDIRWSHFKDEFPNMRIKDARKIRFHHVAFLASLSSPAVLFEQYAVMAAIPKHLAKSVLVFVPYFACGTMERVTKYGEIATAATLSRMLSAIPNCARGPCQVVIFDIHALQNQFYFSDNILVRLETAIPLLHEALRQKYKKLDHLAIAFPDEGAFKRFHLLFNEVEFGKTEIIVCEKKRDGEKRVVTVKEGNPKDLDVVIVDDLVQTGGTLVNCAKACVSMGARSVSCYCTHGVFPRDSWKRFVSGGKDEGLFDTFWITNSIPPVVKSIGESKPFKVLDLSPLYWNVLRERL